MVIVMLPTVCDMKAHRIEQTSIALSTPEPPNQSRPTLGRRAGGREQEGIGAGQRPQQGEEGACPHCWINGWRVLCGRMLARFAACWSLAEADRLGVPVSCADARGLIDMGSARSIQTAALASVDRSIHS